MSPSQRALERLLEGNRRFVEGQASPRTTNVHRTRLAAGQSPFAVVLGCSDSRAPPEIVFDQSPGDLFVIRVAGNIATPCVIASVEFALQQLGVKLITVLGHTQCGAVTAAVSPPSNISEHLQSCLQRIRIAVDNVRDTGGQMTEQELIDQAVQANVKTAAHDLCQSSDVIAGRVKADSLYIAEAIYSLRSGKVCFL